MKRRRSASHLPSSILGLLLLLNAPSVLAGGPSPAAVSAFNSYSRQVEVRLAGQHRSPEAFLAPAGPDARLRQGEQVVARVTPSPASDVPGALIHHWRGTVFAPGARAADFEHLMRDFGAYRRVFAPQVLEAKVLAEDGDRMQASMRVRQKHVITVVMDSTYEIAFGRLDARHGYSTSRSTRMAEIASPGTKDERVLGPDEEHGFLWALNTYWSYEERDDGLYLQVEVVSLTRSVPRGLGWAVGPYVESIPRESLEFTLHATCDALRSGEGKK